MKTLLLLALTLVSSQVFARQYIQCSVSDMSATDVMVINLTSPQGGTLFLSSGMQNPEDERLLVKIVLDRREGDKNIYKVIDEAGSGFLSLPIESMGVASDYFEVNLSFDKFNFDFSCFSRLYDDSLN
jgi:hypothetical protein